MCVAILDFLPQEVSFKRGSSNEVMVVKRPTQEAVSCLLKKEVMSLSKHRIFPVQVSHWAKISFAALGLHLTGALLPAQTVQSQTFFGGQKATQQPTLLGTVNLLQLAQQTQSASFGNAGPEVSPGSPQKVHPPVTQSLSSAGTQVFKSLSVSTASGFGFNSLSHYDQRQANNGNQFSTEPSIPAIAVADGYVLQAVDDAVQVYSTAGTPLLPHVLTANQVFLQLPAINRAVPPNFQGPFLTDMRAFYDQDIDRFIILGRSQLNNGFGSLIAQSRIWMAVSQTNNATGVYNVYEINTTNASHAGCPCVADYPLLGADHYGFYISANEFRVSGTTITSLDATIYAISKADLGSGKASPMTYQFYLSNANGYAFSIQPATTPPGASYFVASGGVEYFVSSLSTFSVGSSLAIWAMSNTISLNTASPNLTLQQINVGTQSYLSPNNATQRPGALTYGSTFVPPASLSLLDGGDSRILSLSYAGARLYATLATQVTDENNNTLVGGAYFILSPTLRSGVLTAPMYRQGYLMVSNNHLLRSFIAVNPQGRGAVTFTLVGPDYFPTMAFVPIDSLSTGSAVQIAGPGALPEDGFTGYPGSVTFPVARWGDNSCAVASADGSIWMATEYIPNATRTDFANWGTFTTRFTP